MIKTIDISNLGAIKRVQADNLGGINLVIGLNQSGKTFILKALFSALKTVETYKRGKENRTDREILSDKLYWTFQATELGSIVRKGESSLNFSMVSDANEVFAYSFGPSTTKQVNIDKTHLRLACRIAYLFRRRRYCRLRILFLRPRMTIVLALRNLTATLLVH